MRYDIHFEPLPPEQQGHYGQKVFGFGYRGSLAVRGPQKLVNLYFKCLLTKKGSDPLNPSYGTGFSDLLGSNFSLDGRDLLDSVVLAIEDCNEQILDLGRRSNAPASERLQSAKLTQWSPRVGGFHAYISIRNTEGTLAVLPLPGAPS